MSMPSYPRVADVLPHAGKMVLLTRILQHAADRTRCAVDITDASPFYEPDSGVPAWVGIEYMAQCIAAHAGLRARLSGEPVKLGFLLGSRSVELRTAAFPPGQRLAVEAVHVWGKNALFSFACSVNDSETGLILVNAHLTVLRADSLDAFLGPRPKGVS